MNIGRPITTTEARVLVDTVQYYRDMCPRRSHILSPLSEATVVPKGIKIFWNYALKYSSKELNCKVSADTLLNSINWKIPFTVHMDFLNKRLGDVISQNNLSICFVSGILGKPQFNYTTLYKDLILLVELLKQSLGIIFVYEINVLSYHKNLTYTASLSEFQWLMRWQLILGEFGNNI